MKHHIRYLMVLVTVLLPIAAWAGGQVSIIKTDGGQVSYRVEGKTCTLTATPDDGFFITVKYITVLKTVDGGSAYAPRRALDIADPIPLTATNAGAIPYEPSTYTFTMPDNQYDVEVTVNFQNSRTYGLLMIGSKMVTEENRRDILGDGGSVKFDGKNTLKLTKADIHVDIQSWLDNLTVYLEEDNNMTGRLIGYGGNLLFTTEGNSPGKLEMKSEASSVISGFAVVAYEQNLTVLTGSPEEKEIVIGTAVKPIVDEGGETNTVDVGNTDPDTDLSNTVVDDILYTLDGDNDDGVDTEDNCVVLGSTMVEDDINGIIESYTPGTDEFASHFAGLTFMLPAGYGNILVNVRTGEHGVLNVKIGNQEPVSITGALDFTDYTIPYACTEATYVFIYSNSPRVDAEAAGHRAGKKTTVTVGVGSVGVTAGATQSSNGGGESDSGDVTLSDDDVEWNLDTGTFVATNPNVTTIADNAFETFPFLKYIDLSGTSITGLQVSRNEGPFAGVSKNTFIYLPAGNSSDESNVVIGKVCRQVVLDGQMKEEDEESFGLSGEFMAQQVVYDRPFRAGEMTTICLPFNIYTAEAASLGTFYMIDKLKDGNAELMVVEGTVEAHHPYLFKAASADVQLRAGNMMMRMPEEYFETPRRQAAKRASDGDLATLFGTYEFVGYDPFDEDVFRLTVNTSGDMAFQRMKEHEYIRPFECYMYAIGQTGDSFTLKGEGITGIRPVMHRTEDTSLWWRLSGVPTGTASTHKGVYIYKGRKTMIR